MLISSQRTTAATTRSFLAPSCGTITWPTAPGRRPTFRLCHVRPMGRLPPPFAAVEPFTTSLYRLLVPSVSKFRCREEDKLPTASTSHNSYSNHILYINSLCSRRVRVSRPTARRKPATAVWTPSAGCTFRIVDQFVFCAAILPGHDVIYESDSETVQASTLDESVYIADQD